MGAERISRAVIATGPRVRRGLAYVDADVDGRQSQGERNDQADDSRMLGPGDERAGATEDARPC